MKRSETRVSRSRWRVLGSAAIGLAAVAAIGLTSITPANAEWHGRDWHDHDHGGVGFGFSVGAPGYYDYGYPYPAYPAYPAYYGYPYYYGPTYGPSFSVHVGH
ncbi:MAG TPA: hypothetical protein VKT77_07565 [Chthonomonadaceae bacterium]|nr:hypothetical protein [Chthonomonadaceae bacterium]